MIHFYINIIRDNYTYLDNYLLKILGHVLRDSKYTDKCLDWTGMMDDIRSGRVLHQLMCSNVGSASVIVQ